MTLHWPVHEDTSVSTVTQHIEKTPGTCGGKARIAGTRIRVQDIYVWHELRGWRPEEIVARFPQVTVADVYAALAYYFDHPDEIAEEMRQAKELVRQMMLQDPTTRPLQFQSDGRHDDPVSPG